MLGAPCLLDTNGELVLGADGKDEDDANVELADAARVSA